MCTNVRPTRKPDSASPKPSASAHNLSSLVPSDAVFLGRNIRRFDYILK